MTAEEFWQHIKRDAPAVAAFIRRKKLFKLCRVFLLNAAVLLLGWYTIGEMNKPSLQTPTVLVVIGLCIVLTWNAKPQGLLFAKPYVGVIETASLETLTKIGDGYGKSGKAPFTANYWVLSVRCDDGTVHRLELGPRYSACYLVGDHIGVLPAIQYPFLLDAHDDRPTVCWWCGSINRPEDHGCMNCGRDAV